MFLSKSAGGLTVLTLAVGIVTAQDSTTRFRTFISDTTLPGVDTGMRDKDAPRPPRPYPADVITRSSGEAASRTRNARRLARPIASTRRTRTSARRRRSVAT